MVQDIDRRRAVQRAYLARHPMREMLRNSRERARTRGVPFDLALDDLFALAMRDTGCAYCGRPLFRHKGKGNKEDSRTLDRLIPSLGYVKGNVVFACNTCNRKKGDLTPDEMRSVADTVDRLIKQEALREHFVYEAKTKINNISEHKLYVKFTNDLDALRSNDVKTDDKQLELRLVREAITENGELN